MKPVTTEKAIMQIQKENILSFIVDKRKTKSEIIKEVEKLFDIKIEKVRTQIRGNKKYVYIKLKKEFPAIDIATKLGFM